MDQQQPGQPVPLWSLIQQPAPAAPAQPAPAAPLAEIPPPPGFTTTSIGPAPADRPPLQYGTPMDPAYARQMMDYMQQQEAAQQAQIAQARAQQPPMATPQPPFQQPAAMPEPTQLFPAGAPQAFQTVQHQPDGPPPLDLMPQPPLTDDELSYFGTLGLVEVPFYWNGAMRHCAFHILDPEEEILRQRREMQYPIEDRLLRAGQILVAMTLVKVNDRATPTPYAARMAWLMRRDLVPGPLLDKLLDAYGDACKIPGNIENALRADPNTGAVPS